MNIQNLQTNNNQTMSSREMSNLCSKEHRNVLSVIRGLVDGGLLKNTIPSIYIHEQNGQQYNEFLSDQRDSLVIVARLSPEFMAAVIDRWQALEQSAINPVAPEFHIPQTKSEALRLAADLQEQVEHQQARLALAEPKAAALDVIDSAIGSFNVRDTAKTLCIPQNKFVDWCLAHDWMYRDTRNKLQMSSVRMKQGFMDQRSVIYRDSSGENKATTQPLFTPKGLTHLARVFAIVHEVA